MDDHILKEGQSVRMEQSGTTWTVETFLGGGGQGEVYRASLAGKPVALKWYYSYYLKDDPRLRERLEQAIRRGPPSDRFLWPIELATASGIDGFGYVMALREERFAGIIDLMRRKVEPNFRTLATAGFELAHHYKQLHAKGLCYRDISFGNVFFDPSNGEVRICDNDNVDINGAQGTIAGTPRFMAPEIVRGVAPPSTQTDLFSLAVLLFYMFMIHHPLEGKKEADIHAFDFPAMRKIYGDEPVFIFDPGDESNRPIQGYQGNALIFWPIYPQFLRDLFTKAFTKGLHDPDSRIAEGIWRSAMVRLRDSLIYCASCGAENFYDADALKESKGKPGNCWLCKKQLILPFRIKVGKQIIMLNSDTKLFPHHVDDNKEFDFSAPVAEVARHPTNPNLWGLKNLSKHTWTMTTPDNALREVDSGRSVSLVVGTKVNFGGIEGEIRG